MKPSRRLLTPLAAILISVMLPGGISMLADNTLRGKKLRITSATRDAVNGIKVSPAAPTDTLCNPSRDSIQASGYDKPLRTNRETILITNSTCRPLRSVALTLTYTDMQGRQLHQRTDTMPAAIPAGHTRMLRLATWDTQHSYYYHRGQKPRTANVTPYDITCHVDFMVLDSLSPESL